MHIDTQRQSLVPNSEAGLQITTTSIVFFISPSLIGFSNNVLQFTFQYPVANLHGSVISRHECVSLAIVALTIKRWHACTVLRVAVFVAQNAILISSESGSLQKILDRTSCVISLWEKGELQGTPPNSS